MPLKPGKSSRVISANPKTWLKGNILLNKMVAEGLLIRSIDSNGDTVYDIASGKLTPEDLKGITAKENSRANTNLQD